MNLGELAEVRQGLTVRGGLIPKSPVSTGSHLLKIGDLTASGGIRIDVVQPIELSEALVRRFSVEVRDIVMANRGNRMTAAMIPEGLDAIASGQLLILKIKSQLIAKEYVHWYLNLERTQKLLLSLTRGSLVKTLSVKVLKKDVDVPIPDREVQMKVVGLAKLAARESELVQGVDSYRKRFIESVLINHVVENS